MPRASEEEFKQKAKEIANKAGDQMEVWYKRAIAAIKSNPQHFCWTYAGGILTGLIIALFI